MKELIIFVLILYSNRLFSQLNTRPTPSFNLLGFKIAELYKHAGDEHYIQNDLSQTMLTPGNYETEKKLYEKSSYYSALLDSNLLFKDLGYRLYCEGIGLDTTTAFALFKEELGYRQFLAKKHEPFFVFDPRQTLEDFDSRLTTDMEFYLTQLRVIDKAIGDKNHENSKIESLRNIQIKPTESDVRTDIAVAEANRDYFQEEMEYHNKILERYDGLLTASIQHQQSIAASIKKDLSEMDDLSKMNLNLLTDAVTSYVGLPDLKNVTNFIQNPNLVEAVNIAFSKGGDGLAKELGKSVSWGQQAFKAYSELRTAYTTGKKFYETITDVSEFIKTPTLDGFINTAKKLADASGREDLGKLATEIEKGKNLWSGIKGCAANPNCECVTSALNNMGGQTPEVKNYLETLKNYNFNCVTVEQLKNLVQNPSFSVLEEVAIQGAKIAGLSKDQLKQYELVKESIAKIKKNTGFDQYLKAGEIIAGKIAPKEFELLKTEFLNKKSVELLYNILITRNDTYVDVLLDQIFPKKENTDQRKFKGVLKSTLLNRSITASRFCKELLNSYPELLCTAFSKEEIDFIKKAINATAQNCETLFASIQPVTFLNEVSFLDSAIIVKGSILDFDLSRSVNALFKKIVGQLGLKETDAALVMHCIQNSIPSLKGRVDFQSHVPPSVRAVLFDNLMGSEKIPDTEKDKLKDAITKIDMGLYSVGKLQDNPSFKEGINDNTQLDSISKYIPVDEQPSPGTLAAGGESTTAMLQNLLIKGAVSYFAPGAMQAMQVLSNMFKQGQLADIIRDKNKELQEAVQDYVDKSLDKDKYRINAYKAEHERHISDLIATGKRRKMALIEDAESKTAFRQQLVKNQISEYSSYYYYLLERLRDSFTKYLWAYRRWYGISYFEDVLREDPNNLRLILDPQVKFLTFFNYSDLGKRKGTAVLRQWEKIIPTLVLRHQSRLIDKQNEENLSPFAAHFEDIVPGKWDDFKRWIITNTDDTTFKVNLSVNLLSKTSTDQWTIGQASRLQNKLNQVNDDLDLPFGFRLLGINVLFIDSLGGRIRPFEMFTTADLRLNEKVASRVNYEDRFIAETFPKDYQKVITIGNFPSLKRQVSGIQIDYFKAYWGIPLQTQFILSLQKNLGTLASSRARQKIADVRVEGFYFATHKRSFRRSISTSLPPRIKISGVDFSIPYKIADVLSSCTDMDEIKSQIKSLEKIINKQ